MNIKEAQRIARSEEETLIADRYNAMKTIHEAIRNGYTLCKVNKLIELVEQMRDADFNYMNCTHCYTEGNKDACDTVLRLLREACDG